MKAIINESDLALIQVLVNGMPINRTAEVEQIITIINRSIVKEEAEK